MQLGVRVRQKVWSLERRSDTTSHCHGQPHTGIVHWNDSLVPSAPQKEIFFGLMSSIEILFSFNFGLIETLNVRKFVNIDLLKTTSQHFPLV